ncbi:type III secretion system translocon subunit SctE [Bradyrhizobium genosp. P]|uniref:type III secretion system translocon subunit SctE n=1 Tax=Bradyrhizobium genosp. P TaxID=83641 RepID=UPI003CFBBC78
MHSLTMVRAISVPLPEAGSPPLDGHSATAFPGRLYISPASLYMSGVDHLPSLASGQLSASGSIPNLPAPREIGSVDLLTAFLALKLKVDDGLIRSGLEDVRSRGEQQKQLHEKIGQEIIEAAQALSRSKKTSRIMKFLGWLAVGLSVAAAAVTGGTLAIVAAAVSVGVAVLNETGVVGKMTQAIAKRLMKDQAMDAGKANMVALAITMGIMFTVSALAGGAGFIRGAANWLRTPAMWSRLGEAGASVLRGLASLAGKPGALGTVIARVMDQMASHLANAASDSAKIAQISQTVSTLAQAGGAAASMAEAVAGLVSGCQQKKAADAQAEAVDVRTRLTALRQLQSDEMDFIKQLIGDRESTTQKVAEAIEGQIHCNATLISHFR